MHIHGQQKETVRASSVPFLASRAGTAQPDETCDSSWGRWHTHKAETTLRTVWHDSQVNLARALFNCAVSEGLMCTLHLQLQFPAVIDTLLLPHRVKEVISWAWLAWMSQSRLNAWNASCAMLLNVKQLLPLRPDVWYIYQYVKDTLSIDTVKQLETNSATFKTKKCSYPMSYSFKLL